MPSSETPSTRDLDAHGYHILGPIAQGGMAEVLLAERAGPAGVRKLLALKRILPDLARDPDFVRMFLNEAKIASRLQHANIVSVFEFGEADGELFLAMEYVSGWELARVLAACARRSRPFEPNIALFVALQIAEALAYAHALTSRSGTSLGIVHRDIAPSNVLISKTGEVKITDFGIARASAVAKTTTGQWLKGKAPYMSPEQAARERLDGRSDIFSAGVVLYEMLTARRLFGGTSQMDILRAVRTANVQPIRSVRDDVPEAVEVILTRALARDRDDRYSSANEFATAIAKTLHGLSPGTSSGDLRAFVSSLDLPPPVDVANLGEGERTAQLTGEQAALIISSTPSAFRKLDAADDESDVAPQGSVSLAAPSIGVRVGPPPWLRLAAIFAAVFLVATIVFVLAFRWLHDETRLEVHASSSDADVWVDGESVGRPPVVLTNLPKKAVVVEIRRGGTTSYRRVVDLRDTPDAVISVRSGD